MKDTKIVKREGRERDLMRVISVHFCAKRRRRKEKIRKISS